MNVILKNAKGSQRKSFGNEGKGASQKSHRAVNVVLVPEKYRPEMFIFDTDILCYMLGSYLQVGSLW